MITLAVDCMGGDHGPRVTLAACRQFLDDHADAHLLLVGLPEALQGFVYAPFRAGDLLKSVLPSARRAGLDYAVYDGAPSAATLLYHSSGSFLGNSSLAATRTLDIAETTVKIHVQHILRKLGLSSRVQAAVYALDRQRAE